MTWFKVDDGFAFNRKAIRAGNLAVGLWVRAGAWCAQQLTDGHVPLDVVAALGGTPDDAEQLVAAGLWDGSEDGYEFRNWLDFQPSKDAVEEEREKARKRKQAWRNGRTDNDGPPSRPAGTDAGTPDGTDAGTPDGTDAGTPASPTRPDPTRPDPTRPVVPSGTTNRGAKRATQMPADWHPKEDHLEIARDYGLDPAFELKAFKDRNEAKGGTYKNWDAAFRTWLNQAKTFRGGQTPVTSPPSRKHIPTEVPDHIDPNDPIAYRDWVNEVTK